MKNQKNKLQIFEPLIKKSSKTPFFSSQIAAGFPSPADDFMENQLDLNELLIVNPAATFFVRVQGNSMEDAHIYSGDILIIDRAKEGKSGDIIVAIYNGEFTVKRLKKRADAFYLEAENPSFSPLRIEPESDFEVWGVVTYIIHRAK